MSITRVRRVGWMVALWFAAGVVLALATRPLFNTIWFFLLWVWALYALLGLILLISLVRLPRRDALWHAAAILTGACILWFGHNHLAYWGERPYFAWRSAYYWPRYRAVVQDVLQGSVRVDPKIRWSEVRGVHVMVDTGAPIRIAFLQPGGLLDNWEGIVYDPTGRVATATGWRDGAAGQYTAAPDVFRVFGGDLVRCEPVEPNYFRCWFT